MKRKKTVINRRSPLLEHCKLQSNGLPFPVLATSIRQLVSRKTVRQDKKRKKKTRQLRAEFFILFDYEDDFVALSSRLERGQGVRLLGRHLCPLNHEFILLGRSGGAGDLQVDPEGRQEYWPHPPDARRGYRYRPLTPSACFPRTVLLPSIMEACDLW